MATFTLKGQEFMCIDSNVKQSFTFTPSLLLFVTCDTENEIGLLFDNLSKGGSLLMPLASYPFAKKFCRVVDRFGLSWQLSLESTDRLN